MIIFFGINLMTQQFPCTHMVLNQRQHFITSYVVIELLNNECILNPSLKNYSNEKLWNILLHGSEDFNCNINNEILKAKIKFLKISERFNGPHFWPFLKMFFKSFFNYVYRTSFKWHLTFSRFYVLFSLV